MRAIGHQIHVVRDLVFGRPGRIAHFKSPQPLHPRHALYTGHDQPQGVAVFRAQHFAVLTVGHQRIV